MQDAMRLGECLVLKSVLARFTRALEILIDSLEDRAFEARRETEPGLEAAGRFRRFFDEAVHEFWAMVGCPYPSESGSLKKAVYDRTFAFSENLIEILPGCGRSFLMGIGSGGAITVDWKSKLQDAAASAEGLACELRIHLDSLKSLLSEKSVLYLNIEAVTQRLKKVL
jgi:hypothetical protein